MMKSGQCPPVVLAIIDGWGIGAPDKGNAIAQAHTPAFDALNKQPGYIEIGASGAAVGLPEDQNGNSEAGHMNIGAGRVVKQDDVVILDSIEKDTFFENKTFTEAAEHVKRWGTQLHLMGLLTDVQSAHSDPRHLWALLDLCAAHKLPQVWLHLFTDGRDSPPQHAPTLLKQLREHMHEGQQIASLVGRFYGMDRKKEWKNTEKAYNLIALGDGIAFKTPEEAVAHGDSTNKTDEFIDPSIMIKDDGTPLTTVQDNDSMVFFNIRSDRARQLTKAFVQKDFEKMNPGSFKRSKVIQNIRFVGMTHFGPSLDSTMFAFPPKPVEDTLPMVLREFRQLYLSESEKFAHVTFFLNGGHAHPVGGEERQVIPSPKLDHYEEQPEMATEELIDIVVDGIAKKRFDFFVVNIAAPDMIAHTGNLEATMKAVEKTDTEIARLLAEVAKVNGHIIITADHGNAEKVQHIETGAMDTEHSAVKVPCYLVSPTHKLDLSKKDAVLGDIAPTICEILEVQKPDAMTGQSLLAKNE